MHWSIVLVIVLVIVVIASSEGFSSGDTTPLIFSGWRYDNRMNPVDNEVERIKSGAIRCGVCHGTGSRDFSRGGVGLPLVGGPASAVALVPNWHEADRATYAEPMCGGRDSMCKCSGNETK